MSLQEEALVRQDAQEYNKATDYNMAILDEVRNDPKRLAKVAEIACERLVKSIYGETQQPDPATRGENEDVVLQGSGPMVCMRQGFETFHAAYQRAEAQLQKDLAPLIRGTTHHLDLTFLWVFDYSCNAWGDWGRHVWRIIPSKR